MEDYTIRAAAVVHIYDWQVDLCHKAVDLIVYGTIWDLTKQPNQSNRPVPEYELMAWAKVRRNALRASLDRLAADGLIAHTDDEDGKRSNAPGQRNKAYGWYCTDQPAMDSPAKLACSIHGWMTRIPELDTPERLITYAVIDKYTEDAARHRWDGSIDTMCTYTYLCYRRQRYVLKELSEGVKATAGKPARRSLLVKYDKRLAQHNAAKRNHTQMEFAPRCASYTTRDKIRNEAIFRSHGSDNFETLVEKVDERRAANNRDAQRKVAHIFAETRAANRQIDREFQAELEGYHD